jgi:phosphatidylserine/phosphatidylglycerophosphate/cardiolipin synthase-like enzyme
MEINLRDKVILITIVAIIAIAFAVQSFRISYISPTCPKVTSFTVQACFSPNQDCSGEIVNAITQAKSTLYIHAYSSVSTPIANAILDAKRRGLDVQVILDKSELADHYLAARFFVNQGIPTWIMPDMAISHNKVFVIDNIKVITGSFNTAQNAEHSIDSILFINDANIAQQFKSNMDSHKKLSSSAETFLKNTDTAVYKARHAQRRRHYRYSYVRM